MIAMLSVSSITRGVWIKEENNAVMLQNSAKGNPGSRDSAGISLYGGVRKPGDLRFKVKLVLELAGDGASVFALFD